MHPYAYPICTTVACGAHVRRDCRPHSICGAHSITLLRLLSSSPSPSPLPPVSSSSPSPSASSWSSWFSSSSSFSSHPPHEHLSQEGAGRGAVLGLTSSTEKWCVRSSCSAFCSRSSCSFALQSEGAVGRHAAIGTAAGALAAVGWLRPRENALHVADCCERFSKVVGCDWKRPNGHGGGGRGGGG